MKYTGTSDGIAKGKRKGTEAFVKHVALLSKGNLCNNGTWGVRAVKGKPQYLSVHATGRAMDLSWRGKSRQEANKVIEMIVANADALGVELVLDYFPKPYGRGYKCTRKGWSKYTAPSLSGAPNGDWYHLEISPEFADDPKKVHEAFKALFK
ncbi:hypothetical protein UFOVP355_6 [uncultured Caudovirales phage]|uniref:Uncharacterized protein n=1 Tax=uncultured Caudovirales phage TaxID=2100421 RepID=A0A6J5NIX7_9CAUD|nr:hypothetical protein UFOVP355_6 [uncultured Caudovirales phage]CAB4156858.1 hypothetical protein UFOVP677_6 [uncultured Caudovirales phage]